MAKIAPRLKYPLPPLPGFDRIAMNFEDILRVIWRTFTSGAESAGQIAIFPALQDGWLECNGATIDSAVTPSRAALVTFLRAAGTAYQGPAVTQAILPDMRCTGSAYHQNVPLTTNKPLKWFIRY